MRPKIIKAGVFLAVTALALVSISLIHKPSTLALTGSDFQAGRIIDDAVFANTNTMSVQDIQNFLNAKVPTCNTNHAGFTGGTGTTYNPPFVCLKDFYENPNSTYTVGYSYTDTSGNAQTGSRTYYNNNAYRVTSLCPVYIGYTGTPTCGSGDYHNGLDHLIPALQTTGLGIPGGAVSAAQIIYNAAQQYSINPQVLIVLLQKEQGLVTDDWPAQYEYQAATGYGCPDTAPCSSNYAGFSNQVISAAWQFRQYLTTPSNYNFVARQNNFVGYYPCASGTTVYIQNASTAALYDYTPYQPDASVLTYTNPTGSSSGPGAVPFTDNCATYGNRNFWWYFNTWFGSSLYHGVPYAHPDGTLVRNQTELQVYLIENGQRLPVQTQESLFSYGYNFGDVKFANYYDDQLPLGSPLPLLKEGTLFKGSGPAIYVYRIVSGTPQKQHFPTWETFTGLGYSLNDVMIVPDWEIPSANFATDVSVTQHPVGALIQPAGSLQVYYLDPNGTKRLFTNQEIFYSYRYNFGQVKRATTADMQILTGNPMAFKEGRLLQGSGPQIYVPSIQAADGSQQKSLITSWFCFVQMGYVYPPDVMRVQDWELNSLPQQGPAC